MSEWITDREPTKGCIPPHECVFDHRGEVVFYSSIAPGEPWKPIQACEPYVKAKRYKLVQFEDAQWGVLRIADDEYVAHSIAWHAREAAERIAAIYEEMMP